MINQTLLGEFDHEMENTRRILERVPMHNASWKPHPKSFSLGQLALHVAELPGYATMTITQPELDFNPAGGAKFERAKADTTEELVAGFERSRTAAREAIEGASDATLMETWALKNGGNVIFAMPRIAVLRGFVMNHMIHHRGQLTVYLRLNDIALPGIYGPSADEPM
ncbi:MAG: DinB family protein [Gemmatimonadaceae bacterium]